MDLSPSTSHLQVMSAIRRKPQRTYRSPPAGEISAPFIIRSTTISHKEQSSTICALDHVASISNQMSETPTRLQPMPKRKYPMAPPLPVYHPLGRLALSLPMLDPTAFGHPAPQDTRDDDGQRSSGRTRRPAAKLRDAEDEGTTSVTTITNAAVAPIIAMAPTPPPPPTDMKEKPSPRKRRTGGGKRKRREADDGDATYPAKRTRAPRGAANHTAVDDESPPESSGAMALTPEPGVLEEKRPERRSTRSRGATRRRDSSASEATSVAGSIPSGTSTTNKNKETELKDGSVGKSAGPEVNPMVVTSDGRNEREDGELSEEGAQVNS